MQKLAFKDVVALATVATFMGSFWGLVIFAMATLTQQEKPLTWAGVGWCFITACTWVWLIRRCYSDSKESEVTQQIKTEPVIPRTKVDVWRRYDSYASGVFLDLPGSREQLGELGTVLSNGGTFSHSSLAGAGKIFTRAQYELLRDIFLKAGLVEWRSQHSHNPGMQLTPAGRAVIRRFAEWAKNEGIPPSRWDIAQNGRYQPINTDTDRYTDSYSHYDHLQGD